MEFHAVIFCGKGSALSPISAIKDTGIPKALLPIANKPMIEYVLEWCDRAPFKYVSILTDNHSLTPISKYVEGYKLKRDPELTRSSTIQCLGSDASSTGSMLQQFREVIFKNTTNFVFLPCDFITDIPPQVLIEVYRGTDDDNLGLSVVYNNSFDSIDINKMLKTNYTVYADTNDGNAVLLDQYSKSSVAISKFLKVRTQLLWRYPKTKVSTKLLDSFILFGDEKMFEIANEEKNTSNRSASKLKGDLARRSWKHSTLKETIGLFILPEQSMFARCNNLAVYMEANRYFLKLKARESTSSQSKKDNKNSATVGADSIVGESTELGEKTSVKRSVIGTNCKIGKRCRITGCVLLNNVTIDDDSHLENCIVGTGAIIESKAKLVNCNIEGTYTVGGNVSLKGETLVNLSLSDLQNDDGDDLYSDDDDHVAGGQSDDDDDDDDDDEDEYDDESFEEEDYDDDIFAR
ncbi:hypothetical protein CANARDRAFT_27970 [[Candida] arabinofermentans NRRL YB-2248]|uniref:Translation initiation factor eIF2B subunit gamma n=1 Tax=[Candida] arabinofermentans NRRL YB-2248 TaxID=983967 RepID=A0A1E4T2C0_9ASCO|nr:hypothetical protein CANARDRAFT_27970 [[Candida] arabinofermentans NRRL YB-2248]